MELSLALANWLPHAFTQAGKECWLNYRLQQFEEP